MWLLEVLDQPKIRWCLYVFCMFGVLITEAESGNKIRCGICKSQADEGYILKPETEREYTFLKEQFGDYYRQDESMWCINDCCKDKFSKACKEKEGTRELELRWHRPFVFKPITADDMPDVDDDMPDVDDDLSGS